jgi:lipopolysaccharide transport protein LptA
MSKHQLIFRILRAVNILFLLFIIIQTSFATEEKLDIKSDKLIIDRNDNISTFEGNVVLEFKDMLLKTSMVKVIFKQLESKNKNASEKVEKIVVTSHFKAYRGNKNNKKINPDQKNLEEIEANYAEYDPSTKKLLIKGNVKVIKADKIIICDELIYYTDIIDIHDENK